MNALEFNDIRLSRSKTELTEYKFSKVRNKHEVVVKFNVYWGTHFTLAVCR